MRKVSTNIEKIIKPYALKNGFSEVRIFSCWKNIMGSESHSQVKPVKLKNKTLQVMVQNGTVATDIAFRSPIIIEKINQFFGYKAVEKITTVQRSFEYDIQEEAKKIPDKACFVRAEARCSNVQDDKLKEALVKLTAHLEQEAIKGYQ
ncbi:MAG: DUF721 domain-containing protein [Proteobacteria bacterium]|nr:DUF721 domain-containing protein [Pseudomonadota bacterium]